MCRRLVRILYDQDRMDEADEIYSRHFGSLKGMGYVVGGRMPRPNHIEDIPTEYWATTGDDALGTHDRLTGLVPIDQRQRDPVQERWDQDGVYVLQKPDPAQERWTREGVFSLNPTTEDKDKC